MIKKYILGGLLFGSLLVPSAKAYTSGNELLNGLKDCKTSDEKANAVIGFNCGLATGIIEGTTYILGAANLIEIRDKTTLGQIRDTVRKFLEENPEVRDKDAVSLIEYALIKAFPPKKVPASTEN